MMNLAKRFVGFVWENLPIIMLTGILVYKFIEKALTF